MSKIKLEVFETDKPIESILFYIYKLVPTEQCQNIQQLMRSAAGKISNRCKIPAFTDDRRIYTTEELENLEIDNSFRLSYESEEKLDIQFNKKIYSSLAEYYIKEQLRQIKVQEKFVFYYLRYCLLYRLRMWMHRKAKDVKKMSQRL